MHLPVPAFFRRLDRHLLLNYPILWILRLHYVLAAWLAGLALIVAVALVLPIRISTVLPFERPYWMILGAIALLAAPWIYRQAQAATPLRHDPRPRTGVVLLAAYLSLPVLFLLWPVVFYRILEPRIANAVSTAEDATLVEYSRTGVPGPEIAKLLRRFGGGSETEDPLTPGFHLINIAFQNREVEWIRLLARLRLPTSDAERWLQQARTPMIFYEPSWALSLLVVIAWNRVVQVALLEDLLLLFATLLALLLAATAPWAEPFRAGASVTVYGLGALATFWSAGTGRVNPRSVTLLTALFFWLLPGAGFLRNGLVYPGDHYRSLAFGLALLFTLAPFVQRRLFALAAAPR